MDPGDLASRRPIPPLHLVTDDAVLARPGFRDRACAALEAGGDALALHLRGPATAGGAIFDHTLFLLPVAQAAGAVLVVNDRVDVALAAGVGAVQLGTRSLPARDARSILGPHAWIGASVHDLRSAEAAARDGSTWLFVGTLYATPSHPGRAGGGTELLEGVAAVANVPLLGIGGVTVSRVGEIRRAGAHGVAVIRGVWDAPDPVEAVGDYLFALAKSRLDPGDDHE